MLSPSHLAPPWLSPPTSPNPNQQTLYTLESNLPSAPYVPLHRSQPFCGNREGWGPLSPLRWDFTPCFLDVLLAVVALSGIVFGAGAVWYLRRRDKEDVKRNWHFWAKMVGLDDFIAAGCVGWG